MQSAEQLRSELRAITRRRDSKKRATKEFRDDCTRAIEEIDQCEDAFTNTPFGAGMSSAALGAVNPVKQEIRTTFNSNVSTPSRQAVRGIRDSLGEL